MEKITAVIFALVLLPGIQLASGIEAQIINNSDPTPTVLENNLTVYNETLPEITVTAKINISTPQVTAYVQQPNNTISIPGVNITAGNQVIMNGNISIVKSQPDVSGNTIMVKKNNDQKVPTINPSGVFIAHTEKLPSTNKSPKINKSPETNKPSETENIKENEEKSAPGRIEPQAIKEKDINLILRSDSTGVFVRSEDTKNEIALPDSIAEEVRTSSRKNVELKFVEQQPVLNINVTKEGRILGIFPASMDVEIQVDAGSREIKSVKKPWWNALFIQ